MTIDTTKLLTDAGGQVLGLGIRTRIARAIRPDMRGLPVTAHAALLARVRSALLVRGQAVVIEYA